MNLFLQYLSARILLVLSELSNTIPASPIRKLVPYAQAAKQKGIHVYHLNIGDPDIKTPQVMLDFLKNWDRNPVGYAHSHGEAPLLESLAGYYHGLGFTDVTLDNIQTTLGGSEGLLWTFLAICNPGDEVVTFEPFYANYVSLGMMAHAKVVAVSTHLKDNFHLPSESEIESHITSKTKAIIICNPSNPTGVVYSREELDMLVGLAQKHNLFLVADEVYREFVYDGKEAISLLEYAKNMPEQIIMVDSLSKRYSLCGARLGCIVSYNKDFMAACLKFAQARLSAGIITQHMAAQLSKVPHSYFEEVNAEYDMRRNVLISGLSKIPGVTCSHSDGAFYVIAELPVEDAEDFAKWLLTDFSDNNETVMVAPAAGFYANHELGKKQVRIAYVLEKQKLERSVALLQIGLEQYEKK